MKNGLLTAGVLVAGLVVFAGTMTMAGAALRIPPKDVVVSVKTAEKTEKLSPVSFPYSVEGTTLTVERLAVYEGPAVEQGSDEPTANALALILFNSGDREILKAQIVLEGEDTAHSFEATHIPGNSRILLVEKSGALWGKTAYTACSAAVEYAEDPGLTDQQVMITQVDMGKIAVSNLTDDRLQAVRIFHKNCLEEIYVGGITYETIVGDLEPGETVEKVPERYAAGYSKVVRVEGKTVE